MDLVWGFTGILSLGHFAFFGIGGYAIGMWLMWDRTEAIVRGTLASAPLPPTPLEIEEAIGTQIFGVVGSSEVPWLWTFAGSLPLQLAFAVLVPGLIALVFGWLAFRSRVTGRLPLDPDAGGHAGAVALAFPERQRAARQQRPVGAAEHPRPGGAAAIDPLALVPLGLGRGAGAGLCRRGLDGRGPLRHRPARHPRRRGARAVPRLRGGALQARRLHRHGDGLRRRRARSTTRRRAS